MERFDAVVVGAGPAGSTTAYHLARTGAKTLLLDRARFPRDKPCGGGLTYRAVRTLPFAVDDVVEDTVDRLELGLCYTRACERRSARPLALMTQRIRLDAYLVERAVAAGAEFRDGVKVESVEALGRRIGADVLVGADGVNGVVARTSGLAGERTYGVALEGNIPYERTDERRWRGRMLLEVGVIPGGYAWVFPKGDHVNVGVGGWESEAPKLRVHLERLCRAYQIAPDHVTGLRGYRLPLRRADSPLAKGRTFLVGDAAGLVDPLSGDGMYEAFVSARLAVDHLDSPERYARAVTEALGPLHSASWRLKLALDRFPRLAYEIARTRPAWRVVERLLTGDLADPAQARGLSRVPMRMLDLLARAT